jgi:hypothetical protein
VLPDGGEALLVQQQPGTGVGDDVGRLLAVEQRGHRYHDAARGKDPVVAADEVDDVGRQQCHPRARAHPPLGQGGGAAPGVAPQVGVGHPLAALDDGELDGRASGGLGEHRGE